MGRMVLNPHNQDRIEVLAKTTLRMRKQKLREVTTPVEGHHIAGKGQRDWKLFLLHRKPLATR